MKTLQLVLGLLKRLLDFFKNKRIQEKSRAAKEDPSAAFAEHFNGRVQSPAKQSDADEAGDKSYQVRGDDVSGK